LGHTRL